jgi:hypothetical protein
MPNDDTDAIVGSAEEDTSVPSSGEDSVFSGVSRRTFLKAAALGTAAAAVLNTTNGGGFSFGPLSAFANDLSGLPCTANDVNILGSGVILNEPCSCASGTFNAMVRFTVLNNAGAGRYCISLHLVDATLPNGTVVQGQDVVLLAADGTSTAPGKSTTQMTGTISNFPCNTGGSLVCFGTPNEPTSGKCAAGACSTIAWTTSSNGANCSGADPSPPGGQCRHQQVCVQGFGASLSCTAGCTPTCGGTSTLHGCVGAGSSQLPITLTLNGDDGSSQTVTITTLSSGSACHDFTVTVTKNTTYTLTAKDKNNCTRTATTSLNASSLAQPSITGGTPDCAGNTTFTATPGAADYKWSVDGGAPVDTGSTNTFTTKLSLGTSHTVSVTVANSAGCTASNSAMATVNPAVTASASAGTPNCSGNVTLTATAGGGSGSGYTFQWFDGGSPIGTGNPLTLTLAPGDHSITVKVTDSAGCSATSSPITVHINQPVAVSASAGTPDCSGKTTLTASASGGAGGYTFQWFDGGFSIGSGNPLTLTLAPGDHSITVTATDTAGCSATSAPINVHVNQPVATALDTGSTPDCLGHTTFTASATGGTGVYTFAWTIDGAPAGGSGNTLAYPPKVDCAGHLVAVTATDSALCVSGNTAHRTITQTVSTAVV